MACSRSRVLLTLRHVCSTRRAAVEVAAAIVSATATTAAPSLPQRIYCTQSLVRKHVPSRAFLTRGGLRVASPFSSSSATLLLRTQAETEAEVAAEVAAPTPQLPAWSAGSASVHSEDGCKRFWTRAGQLRRRRCTRTCRTLQRVQVEMAMAMVAVATAARLPMAAAMAVAMVVAMVVAMAAAVAAAIVRSA